MSEKTSERNPKWTADDLILALDFYLKHRALIPNKTDASVVKLSEDLRALGEALGGELAGTLTPTNQTITVFFLGMIASALIMRGKAAKEAS